MEIIKDKAMEVWKESLQYILDNGIDFKDTDNRICREVLNLTVTVDNPDDYERPIDFMQRFDLVYPSKDELSSIVLNKEEPLIYEYSYGPRIFNYERSKDQINDFVIPLLKKDMTTRRAVVSLFNPAVDSNLASKDIPSLMFMHFRIISGKLNLSCYIRSNDFFIGWPGNFYQMSVLLKYVSDKLDLQPGKLTTISSSAHIFHEHFSMINKVLAH